MADVSKIKLENDLYDIKDATVRTNLTNATTYSTSELIVGKWIDGKTLYRKVVSGNLNTTSSDGDNVNTDIDTNVTDADTFLIVRAYFISNNRFMLIPYFTNSGYSVRVLPHTDKRNVTFINNYTGYSGATVYVIVEYTKLNS